MTELKRRENRQPMRVFVQETRPLPTFFASKDYEIVDGKVHMRNGEDVSEDVNRYIRSAAKATYQGRPIETDVFKTMLFGAPVDVYIFCSLDNGPGYMTFLMMDQEGEFYGSHICSDISFALDDLYNKRPDRQEKLRERFPQGFQVWLLPVGCVPPEHVREKADRRYENSPYREPK